ncbi:MAG: IS1380 family transposase [Intestinibacter sp.]|uniref:IS1380 family transposase n=1 Tax=Intestinibacter sp. TaxID=1965304 RepID=UPI003F13B47D
MTSILNYKLDFNTKLRFNFEGGSITTDAGLLLIKEFFDKIDLTSIIRENLNVEEDYKPRKIHKSYELVIQKICQCIAGYYTDQNCNDLRKDIMFTKILDKDTLASQPTMCRFINNVNDENVKQMENINRLILDKAYSIEKQEYQILDLDSTNLSTYGHQEGSNFNYHYQAVGYHPLVMFDGMTGDLLKIELRNGNCYTSANVVDFIKPYLEYQDSKYPSMLRIIRGDSGFAVPSLYEIAEKEGDLYAIRLKANSNLYKNAKYFESELLEEWKNNLLEYKCSYNEFKYKAEKWNKPRRVVVKMEKPANKMTLDYTFVVTNMKASPKDVISFYCKRGSMENFIKECKNGFNFESMSHISFVSNSFKLQVLTLAYNLVNIFKRLCIRGKFKKFTIETLRGKLIKVAAKIVKSSRNQIFKICSNFPYKGVFLNTLENIQALCI